MADAETPYEDRESTLPRMSLPEHLNELRRRVLISVLAVVTTAVVVFFFHKQLSDFIYQPFWEASAAHGIIDAKIMALKPGEGFLQTIKLCLLVALMIASPIVLWQMWGFVAAGLYEHERKAVRTYFPVSIGLFALGIIAAYLLLIPFGLRFLIGFDQQVGYESNYRASHYLSLCYTAVFGMGFVFQLPLIMLFLQATDMVKRKTFIKGWRIAVMASAVVGMMLTDPSPATQFMMAIPIVGLYFIGIWGGRFVGPDRETFRWYMAWPVVLGALIFAAMLIYSDELNIWVAKVFS